MEHAWFAFGEPLTASGPLVIVSTPTDALAYAACEGFADTTIVAMSGTSDVLPLISLKRPIISALGRGPDDKDTVRALHDAANAIQLPSFERKLPWNKNVSWGGAWVEHCAKNQETEPDHQKEMAHEI